MTQSSFRFFSYHGGPHAWLRSLQRCKGVYWLSHFLLENSPGDVHVTTVLGVSRCGSREPAPTPIQQNQCAVHEMNAIHKQVGLQSTRHMTKGPQKLVRNVSLMFRPVQFRLRVALMTMVNRASRDLSNVFSRVSVHHCQCCFPLSIWLAAEVLYTLKLETREYSLSMLSTETKVRATQSIL